MLNTEMDKKVHFYFCLLTALALSRNKGRFKNYRQKNAFILKWLKNAHRAGHFSVSTHNEISWLKNKILLNTPDSDPEPMLHFIYRTAQTMTPSVP
ncbi:TPA: hypothetical protein ACPYU1_004816 [Raoultella planticola]